MQKLLSVLKWVFFELPSVDGILLAALAFAYLFVKEVDDYLKDRRAARWILFAVICTCALGGFFSDCLQKAEDSESRKALQGEVKTLQGQIGTLISSAQIQATHEDISSLDNHLVDGFSELEAAIKGAKIPKAAPLPQRQGPELPPALQEKLTLTQRRAPSSDPRYPYGLQVIVQTNMNIQPTAFAFVCDGEIGNVTFFVAGQSAYMSTMTGIGGGDAKNVAIVRFSFPAVTPQTPLVVTLLSKTDIRVKQVQELH